MAFLAKLFGRKRKHEHSWKHEMFGYGISRDCCTDQTCLARRFSDGSGYYIEEEGWQSTPFGAPDAFSAVARNRERMDRFNAAYPPKKADG